MISGNADARLSNENTFARLFNRREVLSLSLSLSLSLHLRDIFVRECPYPAGMTQFDC